ncbi:hypothetical protein RM530_06240 [Algiphilus sp. W345]|uniref:Resolvase/invertase-type recombinase catalytic domain-containing protein n=1 Tax=Banduia mediterranea TaxID=3075609 RepID=A0ABU2WGG9_9GAMM|nr:hypothetical protein [Algiphilus sp. W345]MDT0496965.1 hypothetical protein [Algiphilus sp. W345]
MNGHRIGYVRVSSLDQNPCPLPAAGMARQSVLASRQTSSRLWTRFRIAARKVPGKAAIQRAVASSTAIETGKPIGAIEAQLRAKSNRFSSLKLVGTPSAVVQRPLARLYRQDVSKNTREAAVSLEKWVDEDQLRVSHGDHFGNCRLVASDRSARQQAVSRSNSASIRQ